jgi:hypothetical protein
MKRGGLRPLAGAVVLAMGATACIGGGSSGDTTALIVGRMPIGAVQARNGTQQNWYPLKKDMKVPPGATIQVPPRGDVLLDRGALSTIEMRPYDGNNAEMQIVNAGAVDVFSGDVLVKADMGAPISVTSQGLTAQPTPSPGVDAPIFRFDRRVSVRVGVYTGEATITSVTGSLPIPTLREGIVAARALPRSVTPLTVDPTDIWDRTLLPDVIDLDTTLDAQSRGYEAQFGAVMHNWKEIAKIAPNRDLGFITPYFQNTGSADILIGTVFALLLERARAGSAATSFGTLLSLLDEGATWGLLAHEYLGDNGEQALRDAVTRAIAIRTGDIRGGPAVIPSAAPTLIATPTPLPSRTTPPPTRTPTPKPTPTPSRSPSPSPKPSPSKTCVLPPLLC